MTQPVPNLQARLVDAAGKLIPPWNTWFSQFTRDAAAVIDCSATNPLTANAVGTVILTGALTVTLTRGTTVINLNGERIIPVGIGDTVAWTGPATVQFLGA